MISDKSSNFETSTILFKENFVNSFDDGNHDNDNNGDNDNSNKTLNTSSSPAPVDNQTSTDSGASSNQEKSLSKENKLKNSKNLRNHNSNSPLKAQSFQDLHSKATRKRYQHVKSKVKQYIAELQAEDALIKSKKSMYHRSLPENLSHFSKFSQNNIDGNNLDRADTIMNDVNKTNPENLIKILQNKEEKIEHLQEEIEKLKSLNEHMQENLKERSIQLATMRSNADTMRFELLRIKDKERRSSYDYNNLNYSPNGILMNRMNGIRNIPGRSSLPGFINYQYCQNRETEIISSKNSIATQTIEDCPDDAADDQIRSISMSPVYHAENHKFAEILLKKENDETNSESSSIRRRSGHSIKSSNCGFDDDDDDDVIDHGDIRSNISTAATSDSASNLKSNYKNKVRNNLKSDSEIDTTNDEDDDDYDDDNDNSSEKNILLRNKFGYVNVTKRKKLSKKKISKMNFFQKFTNKFICCKKTESFNDGYSYSYSDINFTDC